MNKLIFQVHIKQWDKTRRSVDDVAERARVPDRYRIDATAKYQVLNRHCVVDQHGDDLATNIYPKGRLKTALLPDGSVLLDRFLLTDEGGRVCLSYREKNKTDVSLGCLNDGWIQAKYHWRYRVEQADQIYWMYEEFTLNAACVDELESNLFVLTEPQQFYGALDE